MIPLTIIGPRQISRNYDMAYVDLRDAAVTLCDWLMDRGHTRIALLGALDESSFRLSGYRTALEARGLYDPNYVVMMAADTHPADVQTAKLFERLDEQGLPPPSVIIALVDRMATGIYKQLNAMGMNVPEDIQVASFNDSAIARIVSPSLTTMRLEAGLLGESAVDLIIERKNGREAVKHLAILARVIARESTGPE